MGRIAAANGEEVGNGGRAVDAVGTILLPNSGISSLMPIPTFMHG